MREKARVDANQKQIVSDLRTLGYSVLILSRVGKGCPDILVGSHGANLLVEIKISDKEPMTNEERAFLLNWKGPRTIVSTTEQIVAEMKRLGRIY